MKLVFGATLAVGVTYPLARMKDPIAPLVIARSLAGYLTRRSGDPCFWPMVVFSVFVSRPGPAILLGLNVSLTLAQLPALRRLWARVRGRVRGINGKNA